MMAKAGMMAKATMIGSQAHRLPGMSTVGTIRYRKITQLLKMEGWANNHKRVERIWREEGLQLRRAS